ncbi:translational initiation factor eIF1, partial [Fusarium avenaceum]
EENGRRSLTAVQNLPLELSGANVLTEMKRKFGCKGAFVQDPSWGQVIHLQGDQRHKVGEYLQQADIVSRDVKMDFF